VAQGRLAIAGAIALAACGRHESGPPPLGQALTALLAAADHARAPWRCAALDTAAIPATRTGPWSIEEHTLKLDGKPEIVVGVIADAGGSAPGTLAALARLRVKLAHADIVVSLGGMGTSKAELEATLGTLADRSRPLVALAGDLEAETAQTAAIAALAAKGNFVLDARQIRWIALDGATVATLPGAGAVTRLVAGADGCGWRPADVAATYDALAADPGLRVAMLAEPPRAGTMGELALVPGPAVDVLLHPAGPLTPAREGSRDGQRVQLSPGTADAIPRLPETRAPSAGLLVIRRASWSWRPLVDER
jgi:hypothetical protein